MYKTAALGVILTLTGCASLTGQHTQPLTVTTLHNNQEISGIKCTLTNDAGTWFVTTPGTAAIRKSTGDLSIDCREDPLFGNSTIASASNTAVWGNILLGGVIGYVVDRNTGAGFDYPTSAIVIMRPTAPALSKVTQP